MSGAARATPCRYDLPAGFTGWIVVRFAVEGAPPLPIEEARRVFRIPAGGYLETSSPQEAGILDHAYAYVDAAGRRTPLENLGLRAPGAAYVAHPAVVVCGYNTGDRVVGGERRWYEGFYVGRGPAGDPPMWP